MDHFNESEGYQTPFSASPVLPLLLMSLLRQRHTPNTTSRHRDEYDYIIVGAGSAGSVLANRLSELPCVKVLLLEAGKPTPLLTEIPSVGRVFVFSDIDWKYRTTPQVYTSAAQINRGIIWPLGKTLGGSSAINGMIYVRGNRQNYDEWEAMGAKGWSYNDVFQYFFKLEDNRDRGFLANGWHTTGGPISASQPRYQPDAKTMVMEAARRLGYKFVDPNGPKQHGFYDHQATMLNGQRCSAAKGYLVPAENRTNLDILTRARVLIENKTAVGVEFNFRGSVRQVRASREVILSAGAVNTPQLLLLSGIGPMNQLQRFGIPFVADLPVGENLQDHCAAILPSVLAHPDTQPLDKRLVNKTSIETYIDHRMGPLVSTTGIHLTAFLSNSEERAQQDLIDHQLYFLEINSLFIKTNVQYRPEVYNRVFSPYENQSFHFCLSQIVHPKSRGWVRLRSANPLDPPLINPNYFSHPQDLLDVVEGLKTCHKILTHPVMRFVRSQLLNNTFPDCEDFREKDEDEDLFFRCLARQSVLTISHPAGTAKMGDPSDPTTVVDPELRVKSITGLRVVDASIMPTIVWGNTYIPTVMIAEKAADMIKESMACEAQGSSTNSKEHRKRSSGGQKENDHELKENLFVP